MGQQSGSATPRVSERLIARPRLQSIIDRQRPSCLLCIAPGGYGKSDVLARMAPPDRTIWVNCPSGGLGFLALLHAVARSIRATFPSLAAQHAATLGEILEAKNPESAQAQMADFWNELPDGWTLIIDDVHHLGPANGSEPALAQLVPSAISAGGSVSLGGRWIPNRSTFSKLLAKPEYLLLDADALAFDLEETNQVLHHTFLLQAEPKVADLLHTKAQGWPALVGLAGKWLSLRPSDEWLALVSELHGAESAIYDYLATQLLDELPEFHRHFLLVASLIESIPEPLLDSLLPVHGLDIIRDLTSARFLSEHASAKGRIYSFHPLLRGFLKQQAAEELSPAAIIRIHDRAGDWFAENGYHHEAFFHWHASGANQKIVGMLAAWEEQFVEYWNDFGHWLNRVPPEAIDQEVRLLLRGAMNYANLGQSSDALQWLNRAESAAQTQNSPEHQTTIQCVRAVILFFLNSAKESLAICDVLEPNFESMTMFQQGTFATAKILLHNNDFVDPVQASHYLDIYENVTHRVGLAKGRLIAAANRGVMHKMVGAFDQQLASRENLLQALKGERIPSYYDAFLSFTLAEGKLEIGDEDAAESMEAAIQILESQGAEGQAKLGKAELNLHAAELGKTLHYPNVNFASTSGLYVADGEMRTFLCAAWNSAHNHALHEVDKALASALEAVDRPYPLALCHIESGRIRSYLGQKKKALFHFKTALEIAGPLQMNGLAYRARIGICANEPISTSADLQVIMSACEIPEYRRLLVQREHRFLPAILQQAISQSVDVEHCQAIAQEASLELIRIRTFGEGSVQIGDSFVRPSDWERPQVRELFFFLVLHQGTPLHTEVVADAFWPQADEKSGKTNLNTAISRLRKALRNESAVVVRENLVNLALGDYMWSDFGAIENLSQLCQEGRVDSTERLEAALLLCKQDFLPEYRYQEWLIPFRERIESSIRTIILELAQRYRESSRHRDAASLLQKLLEKDPYDEWAATLLLDHLILEGRSDEARKQWRGFTQKLQLDLGLLPSETTLKRARELKLF